MNILRRMIHVLNINRLLKFIRLIYKGLNRASCLVLLIWTVLTLLTYFWLGKVTSKALMVPPPPVQDLHHLRRNNYLPYYLDNIKLLISPLRPYPQSYKENDPVIIMVASTPSNVAGRRAIRSTWGTHQPTFFVLGVDKNYPYQILANNFFESQNHNDLLVFDMHDHYQNLTLKTMLMMQWIKTHLSMDDFPKAKYVCKTDDDVFINPWTLKRVLKENAGAKLLGYKVTNTKLHRDEYNKWYVPRWLCRTDYIPEYITGGAYVINRGYIKKILNAAKKVRLINLEDVYLTYLVSKLSLNLDLVHDRRMSLFKPWLPLDCAYWCLASSHSYSPSEVMQVWGKIEKIADFYMEGVGVCDFYKNYLHSELFLHR